MTDSEQGRIETERISHIVCTKCEKVLDVGHLPSFSEITCPECGAKQVVPAQFGPFILLGQLGFGGMGVIYRAEDRELGRHVALKVMKKSLGENAEWWQDQTKSTEYDGQLGLQRRYPHRQEPNNVDRTFLIHQDLAPVSTPVRSPGRVLSFLGDRGARGKALFAGRRRTSAPMRPSLACDSPLSPRHPILPP